MDDYWDDFIKTGAVKDYLEYVAMAGNENVNMTYGEQNNAPFNRRDSSQGEKRGGE